MHPPGVGSLLHAGRGLTPTFVFVGCGVSVSWLPLEVDSLSLGQPSDSRESILRPGVQGGVE